MAVDAEQWQAIVENAARHYIAERRAKVAGFCARHFSLRGAWRINRKALGHDLWRTPANILWAPPYLASRMLAGLSRRAGWKAAAERLEKLPPGLQTAVAGEVEWLIYTELLELPIVQGQRSSSRDALLESILAHECVAGILLPELQQLHSLDRGSATRDKLELFLSTYTTTRIAAADLTNSLLQLAAGAAAFQKFTPGTLALGSTAAAALAQQLAIANFALGPALGSLYYGLFPVSASAGLLAATVGGLMLTLGILAALTGIVTDPLQQALGLQERRLQKLLDALEKSLIGEKADFRLRDAYAARVFDIIDLVRSAVRAVG
ncbi:MAG: DUF6635 family protein [Gammaproteobacteria bacterium]